MAAAQDNLFPKMTRPTAPFPPTGTTSIHPVLRLRRRAASSTIRRAPGNQVFIVEYKNIANCCNTIPAHSFEIKLFEATGVIEFHYSYVNNDGSTGSAGIENQTGTIGHQFFLGTADIPDNTAVRYTPNGGTDDEDGLVSVSPLTRNGTGAAVVNVQGISSGTYYINGWIDFNDDGDWADAGEKVANDFAVTTNGTKTITFPVPSNAVAGSTFSRFRLSSTPGLSYVGSAADGEVEDHAVSILAPPATVYVDDTWAALTPGTDPDGVGGAMAIGYDAFATITQGTSVVTTGGLINVAAGAYVGATTIANSKTLAPGSGGMSTAAPNLQGNLSLSGNAVYQATLNGLSPGSQHDQLDVDGAVSLTGSMLSLTGSFAANPASLQSLTIVDNDGSDPVTGIFNGLPEGMPIAAPGGGTLFITYGGGSGNDVVLNTQPVVNGTAAADTLLFRQVLGSPNTFEFSLNGGPFINVGMVTAFTFNGQGGDDTLTVDYANGDAIPGTGLAGEGIFYNGNAHSSPNPGDMLRVLGTLTQNATYTPNGVVGPTDNDGTVSVLGSGVIAFTGLEPMDMVGMAVANVNFPNANDSLTIANGVTFGGGGLDAIRVSGTSGLVAFETVALRNNTLVNIDTVAAGSDGADSVTITSANNAHLNVNLTINTGINADSIEIDGPMVFPGTVTLDSQQIDFNSGGVLSATTTNLDSGAGAITDGDIGSPDVVGVNLNILAGTTVNLDTNVTTINSLAGSTTILREADGVTLASVVATNGPISITAGGTVNAQNVAVTLDAVGNNVQISVSLPGSDILVGTITAGTGAVNDVTLTASNSILDDGNNATRITADAIAMLGVELGHTAANAQLDTTANSLNLTSSWPLSGPRGIVLSELDAVTITSAVTSNNGAITIDAGGTITASSVVSNGANNITLIALDGDLIAGTIDANPNLFGGIVTLRAEDHFNFMAGSLVEATGIGAAIVIESIDGADAGGSNFAMAGQMTATMTIQVTGSADVDAFTMAATAGLSATLTTFSGLAANDTFNLRPQAGSPILVQGGTPVFGDPGVPPGDTLNLILPALVNVPTLTPGPTAGSGTYSFIAPIRSSRWPLRASRRFSARGSSTW